MLKEKDSVKRVEKRTEGRKEEMGEGRKTVFKSYITHMYNEWIGIGNIRVLLPKILIKITN